ncbi:MAG: tRNA (adenosine(37)-N6)-threonylcarbamoyltransferase complex ATPase subunit type 1 TsaE [Candidatus Pacebacteria bacterium]|nr:tRNA (adenosine(37)-N6)-threonylcarbamoyltransferase complex ATPase subunit type 1 TsaE [Candidatus Paceibacterota bacterium]
MKTEIISDIKEMKDFANSYIRNLKKEENEAIIIALFGNLGSGKTTFTQRIAQIFGIQEYVTSPTFVIQKRYKIHNSQGLGFETLIHIDAYRLDSEEELLDLGWEKTSKDPKNIIFIEWPEKIEGVLPKDTKKIYFKFIDENKREIRF